MVLLLVKVGVLILLQNQYRVTARDILVATGQQFQEAVQQLLRLRIFHNSIEHQIRYIYCDSMTGTKLFVAYAPLIPPLVIHVVTLTLPLVTAHAVPS